jgi:hypothetical protein
LGDIENLGLAHKGISAHCETVRFSKKGYAFACQTEGILNVTRASETLRLDDAPQFLRRKVVAISFSLGYLRLLERIVVAILVAECRA